MSAPKAGGGGADQKKGEVNELRTLLRQVNADKGVGKRKRDVVKKVRARARAPRLVSPPSGMRKRAARGP